MWVCAGEWVCLTGVQRVCLNRDVAFPSVRVSSTGQRAGGGPHTRAGRLCIPTSLEVAAAAAALSPSLAPGLKFLLTVLSLLLPALLLGGLEGSLIL